MAKFEDFFGPALDNLYEPDITAISGRRLVPEKERQRRAAKAQAQAAAEPPKTRAELLFQGQKHPKKKKRRILLEQWVEVRVRDGKTTTTLYPSNDELIVRGQKMLPPPEYVYRRINFPDGIPSEYEWTGPEDDMHRKLGGCGIQRMSVNTWLEVIDEEKKREDGHILDVPNLPSEDGQCNCKACQENQALIDLLELEAALENRKFNLDDIIIDDFKRPYDGTLK